MKQINLSILVIMLLACFAYSQTSKPKVFIPAMEDDFDSYLAAAILKNKVPLVITKDEEQADYILTGGNSKGDNKWYDTVFGNEKDKNQGSIQLMRVEDKSIEWAGAAGDKSFWFSGWKKTGKSKVANRLVRQLKEHLEEKAKEEKTDTKKETKENSETDSKI